MQATKKDTADGAAVSRSDDEMMLTQFRPTGTRVASNPVSNTGLNSQEPFQVGLDWLDISFRNVPDMATVEAILSEVETLVGDQIDFCSQRAVTNGKHWDGSGRGVIGTMVWYASCDRSVEPPKPPVLKIAMSGRVMAGVDLESLHQWLCTRAASNDLDCTRIDICLDDRDKSVSLAQITEAHEAGNFFKAKYSELIQGGLRGQDRGRAIYFGSPKSSKTLCIYDKTIESKGKILGNRWEARYKKQLAREALYQWLQEMTDGIQAALRWCKNVVVGCIDFRDRSSDDPNRNRCPILRWFAAFKQRLSTTEVVIRATAREQTVQKSIDWVIKSVAPSLAVIRSVLTIDFSEFMETTITDGGKRLSNARRKLINYADKQKLCY